ncbi:hypothetical protein [Serratia proteamaculans]|uniref:hypothetical protein n=1 Tax=Serratia proteamaculans TaxID=28151 RepID=UPI001576DAC2|nr:hypothetical protein [Serratia proteamaculans]
MIIDFERKYSSIEYDRVNNPNSLSVLKPLPDSFSWSYNGVSHQRENSDKVIPLLLKDANAIAVVEAPFDKNKNAAFILNPDNSIMWDISDIYRKMMTVDFFSDVYYVNNELFYFLHSNGKDFRFSFDIKTGLCGKLTPSY